MSAESLQQAIERIKTEPGWWHNTTRKFFTMSKREQKKRIRQLERARFPARLIAQLCKR